MVVNVVDMNDNQPLFDKEEYRVTIRENIAPGTKIVQVKHLSNVMVSSRVRLTMMMSAEHSNHCQSPKLTSSCNIHVEASAQNVQKWMMTILPLKLIKIVKKSISHDFGNPLNIKIEAKWNLVKGECAPRCLQKTLRMYYILKGWW